MSIAERTSASRSTSTSRPMARQPTSAARPPRVSIGMMTNADLAELLRRAAQDEQPDHRRRALDRAGRAALFWPDEVSALVGRDEDLTSLRAVGPWVASRIRQWLDDGVEPPEPEEIRRDFLTLARARVVLAESSGWAEGLQADLQMHTTWSDGATSLRTMAEEVGAAGYRFAAITDHSKSLRIARGMSEESSRGRASRSAR